MGKISIDLSTIKAAGIYTIEIDSTQREISNPTALRLLPGFNNKGPFNRPVFMQYESERAKVFGDIDSKLEQKGCFFNRMAQTMLKNGPILALNLLKVDDSIDGPDQVNYTSLSLDSCKANPKVLNAGKEYGEYDYQATTIDNKLYGTTEGDSIPYVGKTPYSSLFDRSRFWIPSKNNLMAVAANGLITGDQGSYEHTNLLNFANTGTDEISILVVKPENLKGYDVTAKEWWGGTENIPYGWIRPSDYISDYFIRIVAVKGNWTNYSVLSNDPIWHKYFDKNGIINDKIGAFCSAEGITFIGSWTGCIIPDFVDKQGNYLYIESKVNAATERTGILMALNEDALQVISYDKNGVDRENGDITGNGAWIYDYDGNAQGESELGEGEINENAYLVDMVGHNLQSGIRMSDVYLSLAKPDFKDHTYPTEDDDKIDAVNVPAYFMLKTSAVTTGEDGKEVIDTTSTATVMSFNGLDTSTPQDDIKPTAKIRVLTPSDDNKGWEKAYVVVYKNGPKAKKIVNTEAGNIYVLSSEADKQIPTDETGVAKTISDISSDDIKGFKAFAQKFDSIAYNMSDAIKEEETQKTVGEVLTAAQLIDTDSTLQFMLKEVPVKKDTNDTYVYTDAIVYYGIYAIGNAEKQTVRLFTISGSDTTGSYANVEDLVTISNDNKLYPLVTLNNGAEVKVKEESGEPKVIKINDDNKGYTFSYAGGEYFMGEDGELYKKVISEEPEHFGVNFLSYNYVTDNVSEAITDVYCAQYFNGLANTASVNESVKIEIPTDYIYKDAQETPVTETNLNSFIVTNEVEASLISVGDYVNNIAFYNNTGDAQKYDLIPGVTRVVSKVFVNVDSRNEFYYNGKKYMINISGVKNGQLIETKTGKRGFYLFTALEPVYISSTGSITRQVSLTNDIISHSLKFIPLKGLHISAKHRPGFDQYGKVDIEGGIKKIYAMLEDAGIHRGLCNPSMVDYRYIVDSMSYGMDSELGGKVYLSRLALDRGKTTALLNLPSKRQFELSTNPCFCATYEQSIYTKPAFDTKYIPMGGNSDLFNTVTFSLPTEDDGSKYAAAFWPHLTYTVRGRKINVPPAADVCNVLIRKFQGGDPYVISANRNGIIRNTDVTGVEFIADTTDREYLEPFGVNTIIQEGNDILIYGNQTCYQDTKSDYNKLHVRENLNTLEIACESVLKQYNFLYNTPAVRASVVTALTPILETMKLSQAIEKYNIVCDESNNTNEIIEADYGIVDIEVWMSHGMEKIVQQIKLNRRDTLAD